MRARDAGESEEECERETPGASKSAEEEYECGTPGASEEEWGAGCPDVVWDDDRSEEGA